MVGAPLIVRNDVTEGYVEKSIENIREDQPFILIADGVIIAHAGIEDGARRVCLSLLKIPEPIDVAGYMEADIILMIGTPDPTKHLGVLEQLNSLLEDKKALSRLKAAKEPEEILQLVQNEKKEK